MKNLPTVQDAFGFESTSFDESAAEHLTEPTDVKTDSKELVANILYFKLLQLVGLLVLLFLLGSSHLFAQEKKVTPGTQQWSQYCYQVKLNQKWSWNSDVAFRWKDGFDASTQYLVRTAMSYQLNPQLAVSAGFAHFGFFTEGEVSKIEFRPHQEFILQNKFQKLSIKHRYRLEERFFQSTSEDYPLANSFNFRFRYKLSTSFPLFTFSPRKPDRKLSFLVANEVFLNAGKNIVHNVFDQNRVMLGPALQLNKHLKVSSIWNNQFASSSTEAAFKHTHVFLLKVNHRI